MALNFPDSPLQGDTYVGDNGVTYTYDGDKWVGDTGGGGAANLGDLRISTWNYPGNSPVRLTHNTYGESILVQSTDSLEPGGNNGRSSLRWHIRPEQNGTQGSQYSQVDVQNDGVWIKNADWSGAGGQWYWHFDTSGNLILPQTNMNASPAPLSLPGITFTDGTTQTTAYTGGTGGGLEPYLTIVNGEIYSSTALNFLPSNVPGVIATVDGSENFNVVFYAATGDDIGNMYVIGRSQENNNYPFVYAFSPSGSVLWKQSISMSDQNYSGYLNGIKVKGNYVYVGGTYNNTQNNNPESHFYVTLNKIDGTLYGDMVFRTADDTYPNLYDIDADTNGNVIVSVSYGNQTKTLTNVPVLGAGNHYAYFRNSDLQGYPSQSGYGGQWKIETSPGVFEDCEINHVSLPAQNINNPSATGIVAGVRYDQGMNTYWGGYIFEDNNSSGFTNGDPIRIPGSQMLGTDGDTTLTQTVVAFNNSNGYLTLFFSSTNYPDLYDQLRSCDWTVQVDGGGPYSILNVIDQGANIQVDVDTTNTFTASLSFYTLHGNDATWTWNGGNLANLAGRPSERLKAVTWLYRYNAPDYTGSTTLNLRTSLSNQAVIWTPGWSKSFGIGDTGEYFDDVSYDSFDNSIYAGGYFWRNDNGTYHQGAVFKLANTDGSVTWSKYIEDGTGQCEVKSVLPDGNGNVFVVGVNNNGYTLVTKLNSSGSVVWQSRQTNNNNWNNEPRGALDGNGNVYVTGSWYDNNNYVTSIQKLDGGDGTLIYAQTFKNQENYDMYEFDNEDCQHTTIVGNSLFWAGYTYDSNNNYNIGIALRMPIDGSATGNYGRWRLVNDTDATWEDCTNDAQLTSANYDGDAPSTTTVDTSVASLSTDVGSATATDIALGGITPGITGVDSITFNDGTSLDTGFAGIQRHSTTNGNNNITLAAEHNGKFLHYYGSDGNSWIYVPSESDVSLPIGYTVTIVIDDFNGNYLYINNNTGSQDAVINAVGYSPGTGNYWVVNNNGQIGVYTLMKVDTDRWVLSGPDIQID